MRVEQVTDADVFVRIERVEAKAVGQQSEPVTGFPRGTRERVRRAAGTLAQARPIRFTGSTCAPNRAAVPSFHSACPISPISRAAYRRRPSG
ncbi:hypothetical protein SGA01_00130 [Streptomyces gardneri]|uniref:Uncharacterized protein n=1 Tax=Streptomyces gardneri TaxID=66892 RepID=A0A4Y3RC25_9ACTN|nr:hypothetical protein SGA01_00130 [Streptomyces gardneri]